MKKLLVFAALCLPLLVVSCNGEKKALSGTENGHDWVDLGLSVKWATCNVGAEAPEDPGLYFAWGERNKKADYLWATYNWCQDDQNHLTKYNPNKYFGKTDIKKVLVPDDDVATKWGSTWRMPTKEEWEELYTQCTWEWTGKGYKVSGRNGQSIFLPAAGSLQEKGSKPDSDGNYWSSSLDVEHPIYAFRLNFSADGRRLSGFARCVGLSVRPVLMEKTE